jgi:hypothetical protein
MEREQILIPDNLLVKLTEIASKNETKKIGFLIYDPKTKKVICSYHVFDDVNNLSKEDEEIITKRQLLIDKLVLEFGFDVIGYQTKYEEGDVFKARKNFPEGYKHVYVSPKTFGYVPALTNNLELILYKPTKLDLEISNDVSGQITDLEKEYGIKGAS